MDTKRRILSAAVAGAMILVIGQGTSSAKRTRGSSSPVVGVWHIAERATAGSDSEKNTNPQPGVRIFTQRYYSFTEVTADAPRPDFPAQGSTDKQRADAWGPFTGQAGTYEIKGNELTTKRIAAKNPSVMKAGSFTTYTFRMEGNDTLWLTEKTSESGPVQTPLTIKLTRLE